MPAILQLSSLAGSEVVEVETGAGSSLRNRHWHEPGIQPADVTELLEHGATVVVLTKGVYERFRICPETLELLADRSVAVHVLQTEEALGVYNRLAETDRVGGLFHSTC
jgi:hypothetical protein